MDNDKDLAALRLLARPNKWTLLLTGDNYGLVGERGMKWEGHPEHYERVDVVAEAEASRCRAQGGNKSVDLGGLTRYKFCEGDNFKMAEFVKLTEVQALLATPARDVGGLTPDKMVDLFQVIATKHGIKDLSANGGKADGMIPLVLAELFNTIYNSQLEVLATSPAPSVKQERAIDEKALQVTFPLGLHHETKLLVARFAEAMAGKLHIAERKYGYGIGWTEKGWLDECRAQLIHHLAKGDPRDVANYCAFLWWHSEPCAAPSASQGEVKVPEGFALVPKDPTPEMVHAARFYSGELPTTAATCYRAMIAAATAPSVMDGEGR